MTQWLAAHGGFVGLGILAAKYILIGFSIASFAVIAERLWMLSRIRAAEARDYRLLRTAFANRDALNLRTISNASASPSAAVVAVGMEYLSSGEARLREATQSEVGAQIEGLQHNLPILATAASTSPYVGLFGTVLGILAAFRDIAQTNQTGASVIAGGISEALTSTALGLGVAIPAVMAYNYFTARVNALSSLIETHALDVTERVVGLAAQTDAPVVEVSHSTPTIPAKSAPPEIRKTVVAAPAEVKTEVLTPDATPRVAAPAPEKKQQIGALEAMKRGITLIDEDTTAPNGKDTGDSHATQ